MRKKLNLFFHVLQRQFAEEETDSHYFGVKVSAQGMSRDAEIILKSGYARGGERTGPRGQGRRADDAEGWCAASS